MLDFFLIDDSQSTSNRKLVLQRVGGIEDELFYRLQAEGIIEAWLDYYGTFRWGSENVMRILHQLLQKRGAATLRPDEAVFVAILQRAVDAQCGLLARGD
ncbi:hypothetical protein [Solirubrum puertoriconensis]|uniref:Uncharacterized protein n=1 Tax=Solirubrum puertoriconensis TaxID=1751427 RepID=A0A9X0L5L8_SOLP1|nr:hypothetical protein [Solirubrum puertoriconensis]KUG08838.1 hypothetical protein ASU33_11980 [Solirubrum puertoriconensis]